MADETTIGTLLVDDFQAILDAWLRIQAARSLKRTDLVSEAETEEQSRNLLDVLARTVPRLDADPSTRFDMTQPVYEPVCQMLEEIAEMRTERGVSGYEMGQFVGALKEAILEAARARTGDRAEAQLEVFWAASQLVDQVVLTAIDSLVRMREETIERQRSEMNEVAAPVVRIWDNIVTIPLIGTLDSYRAQTVMENLLDAIVRWEAEIAIIDITGVSTVDTLVAQHLLKTAAAVRLMGSECVICGISPKIAQTVVNLGVDLPNITTRVDLQSGLAYAFKRVGATVERQ